MRLDHVGIATDDLDGLTAVFEGLFGATLAHEETLDGLSVAFLEAGGPDLELLEPLGDTGTVARFIDRRGPGLHHLAFEVAEVAAALEDAGRLGLEAVDDEPRPGARGHTVAFLHPGSTGGVLVEFVEH